MQMDQFFSKSSWEQIGKVVIQSGKDFIRDNCPQWAAAISYYTLLSLFPLLLAATSIAAYFVDAEWAINQGSRLIEDFIPNGAQYVQDIVEEVIDARGQVSILSILILGWSGSRVFGVVTKALNIAYDVDEPYGFLKRTLVELLMTVSIGLLFVLALGSRFLVIFLDNMISIPALPQGTVTRILQYAVPTILLLISLFLTYRFVPRRKVEWWTALVGAVVFTILFQLAQPLFTGYIQTFANYNLVYGPLAIVITLVLWTWIAASFFLFGGEIVSHLQDMIVENKSQQEVDEKHEKRDPTNTAKA